MDSNLRLNIGMKKRNRYLNRWDSSPFKTLHDYLLVLLFQIHHLSIEVYTSMILYMSPTHQKLKR